MVKVVARNFAQAEQVNKVIELYKELVEETRKEEGCIRYELYQDSADFTILTMLEEWESREALDLHMKSEHFIRIVPQLKPFMRQPTELNIYSKLL